MTEEELNNEEKELMSALLNAHPNFGETSIEKHKFVSIAQALKHKAVPLKVKQDYVNFMHARYPTSNFNFVIKG